MEEKIYYKITDKSYIRLLFWLCWIVYFTTYLGRLNYSASLAEMILSEGFTKGQAGMIGTGFFFAYGAGQFVSGFLGDRLSPKYMVFMGVVISSLCNLLMVFCDSPGIMAVVWCINGLSQALVWSPMIRLLYEYLKTEARMSACVALNSSVPIGTMVAYGVTAIVIYVSGWRLIFVIASILLLISAFLWWFVMGRIETYAKTHGEKETVCLNVQCTTKASKGNAEKQSLKKLLFQSGLCFLFFALFVQGALKDGVTTWVPTYISETYGISSILAIVSTMVIPIFNLFGVYLAAFVNRHWFHEEVKTSSAFFGLCAIALLFLNLLSGKSLIGAFLMLAIATTAMMAVNTMLIAVLPSYFGVIGRASSISGLLNSSVYVGGAVSTYGIGVLSSAVGWNLTILCWVLFAVVSMGVCAIVMKPWNRYKRDVLKI